ncbi:MAG TPA: formate/nitrite family transporter [Anaerolineales bacterium]|jgi:formate/nitrite transporter|nr:formate/nitrite family transporter [Anaerolineales bacterium]
MTEQISFDALLPPAMAAKAEDLGVKKAGLPALNMFVLAVLAGAFIGIGAIFATTVAAGGMSVKDAAGAAAFSTGLPFGITRLLVGLSFTVGLILVIVGGAELFTGNTLITIAFASKKVTLMQLLRNWTIVYIGNLVGSILTAYIVFLGKQYSFGNGAIGLAALNIGEAKTAFTFVQAVALGIMCNALVCMAVWMCYSARSTTDKILAIIPPIATFVAAGFEHSVANMYFVPVALFVKGSGDATFFEAIGRTAESFPHLTWGNFFIANLLPVTIGNIIGGGIMVGLIYWFVYLRKVAKPAMQATPAKAATD